MVMHSDTPKEQIVQPCPGEHWPDAGADKNHEADYAVGYGRPPKHSRFKPGQSGNPRGRPAGRANARTTLARVLGEPIIVREGQHPRKMSKFEAMIQAQANKGMKGDARSAALVLNLASRAGLLAEVEADTPTPLSAEDRAGIDDYLRRHAGSATGDRERKREMH